MTIEVLSGRNVHVQNGESRAIKLWGIIPPEDILDKLTCAHADPRENDAVIDSWGQILSFLDQGGVVTSSGLLVPNASVEELAVSKGTKKFLIEPDFVGSLGYVRTVGRSVNLTSNKYGDLLGIRKGFGNFVRRVYQFHGLNGSRTIDPHAVAQQILLDQAIHNGQGDLTSEASFI